MSDSTPATAATLERVTLALAHYIADDENPPAEAVAAHTEAAKLLWGPTSECRHCEGCPPPHHDFCGSPDIHGEHPMESGRLCCGRTP